MRWLFISASIMAMLFSCPSLMAADADRERDKAIKAFEEAMSSGSGTDKKKAMQDLAKYADDDAVKKKLAGVVDDRQIGRLAIKELGKSTGDTKSTSADDWNDWLKQKEAAEKAEAEKNKIKQKLAEVEKKVDPKEAAAETAKAGPTSHMQPDDTIDLGRIDRVFFTDGSVLSCYIILKRKDLDGKLTSVRIMHRNRSGEEVIEAHLISHIEEDYK